VINLEARMKHVVLQERDLAVLIEVARSPACTRDQIAARFFEGSYEAAKKRIQALSKAGLIQNNDKSLLGRTVVRLTKAGAKVMSGHGFGRGVTRQVSSHMLRHEILLSKCLAAFRNAAEQKEWLMEIETEEAAVMFAVQCVGHSREERVTPDALVALYSSRSDYFFVELDRGTETQNHLVHLASQYRSLSRLGDFHWRGRRETSEGTCMRVLFVMTSRERLKRTARLLHSNCAIRTLVWLCHVDEFLKDPFGAEWSCPADFQNSSNHPISRRLL
jgi:hypothetical protein